MSDEIQIYEDSDLSSEIDVEWNSFKKRSPVVNSMTGLKLKLSNQRNKILYNITKNLVSSDLNIEHFYYDLFSLMLSPLENQLKKANKFTKELEANFFNEKIAGKLEFAKKVSEIEEYLLELKALVTNKQIFLNSTHFNFDILGLGRMEHRKQSKSKIKRIQIFKSRMSLFMNYLQTKCEEKILFL